MSSLRFARSALRARPSAAFRVPFQRRGYAEAVSDKIKLSLALPHQVNIPAESGEMGVLANHVPSIEQLKPGLVEIVEEGGDNKKFFLSGGFAVVQPDSQLSINAVEGFPLEDFSAENVRFQITEAQKIASGNGSEQDIAEAKIELEPRETGEQRFDTVAEELPTSLPTSFSPEIGLMEENSHPSSYLLESPDRQQTKATLSYRQGSALPSFTQNSSLTLDHVSGDEEYKDVLLRFPRLYSGLTFERDPFFDSRGIPLNPQNTPISQSGRQSEIGSCEKDKRGVRCPAKSDNQALGRVGDAAPSDDPFTSLLNGKATWRPPKPPKPSFLSDIDFTVQNATENARPSLRVRPPKRDESKRILPETPYRSLPLRPSRNLSQFVECPATELGPEQRPGRPKQSWETRSIIPCRYFPRPFTRQELDILGIPLNNPEMPFPALIPTIDKLPLRRGIINFDWKQADQYPLDVDNSSTTREDQSPTAKQSGNAVWQLSRKLSTLRQLFKNTFHYSTPRKQPKCTKQNPRVRTTITVPFVSKCETCPGRAEEISDLGLINGAYVLEIDLAFPLLFVHRTTAFAAFIRFCISSKIAIMTASLVRAFMETVIRWVLSTSRVEVAVEIRRV
ncbi:hypothetical protein BDW62DRAFT_211494 [Aspergillus aurantiobrunneus]